MQNASQFSQISVIARVWLERTNLNPSNMSWKITWNVLEGRRKLWQPWNRKSCLSEVIQKVFMRGKRPVDRALRWPTSLLMLWTEISNIGRISLVLRGETSSAATWSPTKIQCCEGNECGSLKLLAYGTWGDTQIDAVDIYRGLELISLKPEDAFFCYEKREACPFTLILESRQDPKTCLLRTCLRGRGVRRAFWWV